MDRKRAAAALLALAACIACTAAAPTASNQTALELMDGPTEGCYYNFQHYGEGDRIMTNEPCLNCTCHNRMLMCYLRVCPFTKPIGQDCTVEKRADQCCPIVTCPDVPVDLLTSTSTSSPAEYGTTGVGKLDKYGCSINGKYFSEGSKVPSTPNKPCEHCYCIRNMTTCVMQECTLHVDGCTPIYHKDVCCPVRYSCDHPEDDILLLDDMTTTVRPTPGFLLTTTTAMPVTQLTQDCVHDDQIFPDGTLIKTEKACEHCYCMKGDIVCVVQECGTPMENEGKNCTSLPPRPGQCCPDTYICEGDERGTELTTEIIDEPTQPPRRVGVEGSGYRNEPDEIYTEKSPFETDIEGSGEDYATDAPVITVEDAITEKKQPDIIDDMLLATTEKEQIGHITEPDKDQNTIPDIMSGTESSELPETIAQTTEANVELASISPESKTTISDEHKTIGLISKEDDYITTESAFRKEDNNIVSDEILTIKDEKLPTTSHDLVDETTIHDEHLDESTEFNLPSVPQGTTMSTEYTPELVDITKEKETTTENQPIEPSSSSDKNKSEDELSITPEEDIFTSITTVAVDKTDTSETTTVNPEINEVDENISPPGRIPGEGDCLLNGITYRNNTIVPSNNNCHTSCKCISSIIKCDPIICSSPPEYMENMNDCQPIYDTPDACCPTYVCSAKETIPPQSHSQMSGTESPKPITVSDCNGQDCKLEEDQKPIPEPSSSCTSGDCLNEPVEKQDKDKSDCNGQDCKLEGEQKPESEPSSSCPSGDCLNEPVEKQDKDKSACNGQDCKLEEDQKPISEPSSSCTSGDCLNEPVEKQDNDKSDCNGQDCKQEEDQKPVSEPSSSCTSGDCLIESVEIQDKDKSDCGSNDCGDENAQKPSTNQDCADNKCEILPAVACEGENCLAGPVTSIDTHKTPISENVPSLICNENGDCKKLEDTQQDECQDEICKKQDATETEVKVPLDCTEPECITQQKPESPSLTEQSTDLAPEKVTTDTVTQSTLTQLDIDSESPVNTVQIDENVTEYPTSEVTKVMEMIPSEGQDKITETADVQGATNENDQTESPTTANILEKQEDTKTTEQTSIEHITETSGLSEASKDEVTKATPTDQLTTDREIIIDETSEHTGIKSEDNLTDKMEVTTENLEIITDSNVHSTKLEETTLSEDSENQKINTEIPELDINALEKLTPTEANQDVIEKEPTIKDITETHETKEEKTDMPVLFETTSIQTEQISTDLNKATEAYESSQITNEPHEQTVDTYTEKDKIDEEPETHEPHEIITEKETAEMTDVTQPSESHVTNVEVVTTEKSVMTTVSHIIPTDLPQSMQTKLDEEPTKDISQETVTDKHEMYTEPSDSFTAHHEDTTSELPIHNIDNLHTTEIKSEVTEEPISEKITTFTESSETLQTKPEDVKHELEQPVTEKQDIDIITPDHSIEKLHEGLTTPISEHNVDIVVTEKEFTEAIESETTKMQETFTESPTVHATTLEETITKDYDKKEESSSSSEQPALLTTIAETIRATENQDAITKESEEPITEKESHTSGDIINTTSETFKEPVTEIDQHLTEKAESSPTESIPTLAETDIHEKPTSETNEVDKHDLESDQLPTTTQDKVIVHEATTIALEPIAITESQTESPSITGEKVHETSTENQEDLPLQTEVNDVDTTDQQSPKPDGSSIQPTSDSERTTEYYVTESQKIQTTVMDESQSQLDLSTTPSSLDHKLEESSDTSKLHEDTDEMLSKVTTINPQNEKEEVDKETALPIDSEQTSYEMERTTASLISVEDKESLPYTTESNINIKEQETDKTTAGIVIDEEIRETTGKSVSEEEGLPQPTHEYVPSEAITEEISSQAVHDITTEKPKLQDDIENSAPIDISTKQPELFTKSEETGITETESLEKEKETVTESLNTYETSDDLDETSAPTDKEQPDEEHTYKSEDDQVITTASATKLEQNEDVTKTPVADVDHITEISMHEKDEIVTESTVKTSDNQILEVEKEPTVSDLHTYTTEPQLDVSEKAIDETTQRQDIPTDKIITTENPESVSSLDEHETTLSSLEDKEKIPHQETTTEKQADYTKPISELQHPLSESIAQNTEDIPVSTTKVDAVFSAEDATTTQKSLEEFEKVTSHTPDYQTTESVLKDESTSESSQKDISTSPELMEPEKGYNDVTEINHEFVTEKEISQEPVDIGAHTITTESNEVDIVAHTSPEAIPTDVETETNESDILEKEHDITKPSISSEIPTSTDATKLITEKQEIAQTESSIKELETIEPQYTTIGEQKQSSTEASDLSDKEPEHDVNEDQKLTTLVPAEVPAISEDSEITMSQSTNIPYQPEVTTSIIDSQDQSDIKDKLTTFVPEDTSINIESTKPTITDMEKLDQPEMYSTQLPKELQTERVTQKESGEIMTESVPTLLPNVDISSEVPASTEKQEKPYVTEEIKQTTDSDFKISETTPFLVELEEHTHHVVDESTTKSPLEEIVTTMLYEVHGTQQPERGDQIPDDISTFTHSTDEYPVSEPSKTTVGALEEKEHLTTHAQEQLDELTTVTPIKSEPEIPFVTEKLPEPSSSFEPVETKKDTTVRDDIVTTPTTVQVVKDYTTESIDIQQTPTSTLTDVHSSSDIPVISEKPLQPEIPEESEEKLTPEVPEQSEEKLTSEIPKETTSKISEETSTYGPPHIDNVTKHKEKPVDTTLRPSIPEVPKPEFIDDNVELPSPDFPPSGGYGQEPDYIDEDQAFGPGTCRYGGKVYVSAQQIPRDDPCDFCFCFRSDIICLQQSCPPPIHGCHEEPIQGFCCPRYECPVSMATTLNVTTTTTTTTTTLPPHFLPHAYKGQAQRRGCQIKGHTYKVGEVVRASSGPCLHCTCGGDGQMKCDPKACTPEPMLRQMIAAAVSAKRRR